MQFANRFILLVVLPFQTLSASAQYENSPFIGTWKCTHVDFQWDADVVIIDPRKDNFESTITFFEDGTWVKTTAGEKRTGKFEQKKPNKIDFLELNYKGEYEAIWSIRWPNDYFDPDHSTEIIDFIFPEIMEVKTSKIKRTELDVDGHYVKIE